jgi:hypothetical protein
MELEIKSASWHRNGVGGVGFYAILFTDKEQGNMVASLFDESGYCAIYNVDELVKGNISFACGNSWRGDRYESELRPLLQVYLEKEGGNRIGPFALPEGNAPQFIKEMGGTVPQQPQECNAVKS